MNKFIENVLKHPMALILLKILSIIFYPIFNKVEPRVTKNRHAKIHKTNQNKLFPSFGQNTRLTSSIKPCSTVSSQYLPIKTENGEIEWAFTDEMDNSSIDSEFFEVNYANAYNNNNSIKKISPITSNSDNDQSSFDDNTKDITPASFNSPSSFNEEIKLHRCPHCEATFKLRGYLTRHLKKHSDKKAYSCPFHKFSTYIDDNNITHKCHPTGGFSRRDTYKTHLKSRHFKYPKGTLTKQRAKSSGNCSMCGEFFENSEIWCEIHIEGGECKYLPVGFKGKSRIKNKLKKELKKKGLNEDEFFNNLSHLSPQSQNNDLDFHKLAKHRQHQQKSPVYESAQRPETYSEFEQSKPIDIDNSVNVSTTGSSNASRLNSMESPFQNFSSAQSTPIEQTKPQAGKQIFNLTDSFFNMFDYDDEFCLDLDQRPQEQQQFMNQQIMQQAYMNQMAPQFQNQMHQQHIQQIHQQLQHQQIHQQHQLQQHQINQPQLQQHQLQQQQLQPQLQQIPMHQPSQIYNQVPINSNAPIDMNYYQGYFENDDIEPYYVQTVHN